MELKSVSFLLIVTVSAWFRRSDSHNVSSVEMPYGCTWRRGDFGQQQSISCRVPSIWSATELLGNLPSLQANNITSLSLQCSEDLFPEEQLSMGVMGSSLPPSFTAGFLSGLPMLQQLHIDHCRLRSLPGGIFATVQSLRQLSFHSHNSHWSTFAMELDGDALRGLSDLRELDLGENNIWTLPGNFLCSTPDLLILNLTANKLQDIASLGLYDLETACTRNLERLDLSLNELSVIPDSSLCKLRNLISLKLQNNAIAAVGDLAFSGLLNLISLNISSNRLVALPPELFNHMHKLRELILSNNSLSVLAPGLLDDLTQLETLDISHNKLTSRWVNDDTFTKVNKLVFLDLSYNILTKIDSHVFRGLQLLQKLNLEYNEIEFMAAECFISLVNLHSLSLSHNKLVILEAVHIFGLISLDQLFLDNNKLHLVHRDTFVNLTSLQDLRLNGNYFTEIPSAIQNLGNLKTLDLGNNHITDINSECFVGLNKLSGLRLVDNKLENISQKVFINLPALQILNLASNAIRQIEQGAFNKNSLLIAIRVDGNQLTEMHGIFQNLPSLLMLNISDNKLLWFNYSDLPTSLEWLDLHSNQISTFKNDFIGTDGDRRIKKLDASFNLIEEISDALIPNSIEKLYLHNNRIRKIAPGTFTSKRNLKKVMLTKNEMQHIEMTAIDLPMIPHGSELPKFYISENPFICDCKIEWLLHINDVSRKHQNPRIMDLEIVTCEIVHSHIDPKRPIISLKSSDFLCQYRSHCFDICHCCDFDACDCEMTCPDNCSCYHDNSWSSNIIDCSNAGYLFVPERIPMDATEIHLDGNYFRDIGIHAFIGKRKLEILFLNNSGISHLRNNTFNGAETLKILHLESNALRQLKGFEFDRLQFLQELYLGYNAIATIANTTFSKMKELELLRLNNNRIVNFQPWELIISQKTSIDLEGNTWCCDCANAVKIHKWLMQQQGHFVHRMYCSDGIKTIFEAIEQCINPSNEAVSSNSEINVNFGMSIHNPLFAGGSFVPLLAGVLVIIIAICLIFAIAFAFRQDIQLWAHSRYGLRLRKISSLPEEERDRLYDGYVVYSERDGDFITRYLAAELEQLGLALCMHWRDLPPTQAQESVPPAAAAAKRIIIAFSPIFHNNEWQQPEFRAALRTVLESIRPASRRRCIIILLALETPTRDPELQLLLQTCTVIVWGEKRFWQKLRFAMPDSLMRGKKNSSSYSRKQYPNLPYPCSINSPIIVRSWSNEIVGSSMNSSHATSSFVDKKAIPLHVSTPTPTQSTYVSSTSSRTDDEDSSHDHQQQKLHLNYQQINHQHRIQQQTCYNALQSGVLTPKSISTSSKSSHLYSTIPESVVQDHSFSISQKSINPCTYFV